MSVVVGLCICVSAAVAVCLRLDPLSLSAFVRVCFYLSLSICFYLSLSFCFLPIYVSVSALYFYPHLSMSVTVYISLYFCLSVSVSVSVSLPSSPKNADRTVSCLYVVTIVV